jgi:opacity protein-like surface antigen
MRRLTVWTFVALLAFAGPAAAQSTNFGLGAFAGVSLPMSDYGDSAELGFSGGLDLFYPLGMSGLSWLSTASVTAHSVDAEDADGGFLFIPLLTGLRYDIAAGPVGVFVNGQAGAVFNKGPEGDFFGVSVDSDWSTEFGFALGGGVQATENIYAGVKYFPLGDVDFSYGDTEITGEVSFLEIFVGFGVR